jgi:hypothetical protein
MIDMRDVIVSEQDFVKDSAEVIDDGMDKFFIV